MCVIDSLDHDYTASSLGWNRLKNADRPRAEALAEVARRLDCEVFLALADVHETWDCEEEDYRWSYRDYRRYQADEDEDDDPDPEALTLTDLVDSDIELRHWIDASGKPLRGIPIHVGRNEVCHTRATVDLEPFRSEHEGWMGNYGNTVERWYHRAAVVMWPRSRSFALRAEASPSWAIGEIARSLRAGSVEAARERVRSLAPFWPARAAHEGTRTFLERALRVAAGLADRELAASLLSPFRLPRLGPRAVPQLADLVERYGVAWCRERFLEWEGPTHHRDRDDPDGGWLGLLPDLSRRLAESGPGGAELAPWLVARQWTRVQQAIEEDLKDRDRPYARERLAGRAGDALRVLESCAGVGAAEVKAGAEAFLTASATRFPVEALVAALRDARARHAPRALRALGLGGMRAHCAAALTAALAAPARDAGDWSIAPPMRCRCELCRELGEFLARSDQIRREWPLAQAKRAHVHQQLERYALPVSHVTRRAGRPFTLVLEKTDALFRREAEARRARQRDLAWLERQRPAFG